MTKLPLDTKAEFARRLTDGVAKGFWYIIEGKELERLRQPGSSGHFLPSGYVLKHPSIGASTKACLVLDPSMAYNQRLLAPVNAENTIASVLRKLQALPVCAVYTGGLFPPPPGRKSVPPAVFSHGLPAPRRGRGR